MYGAAGKLFVICGVALAIWILAVPAAGDRAVVHLKDGRRLRGDVSETEGEVVIRNAAGEMRFERARVERIEWLDEADTADGEYLRRFRELAPDDVKGHFGLARWLREQGRFDLVKQQCEYVLQRDAQHANAKLLLKIAEEELGKPDDEAQGAPPAQRAGGPPVTPPISKRDILRLKLLEYPIDGDISAERSRVRFKRQPRESDLGERVLNELRRSTDFEPEWERTLRRGTPHQKVQLILRETGMKHADRIEIRGDTEMFALYRRRVASLLQKGCVRSGCHGARGAAHVFRFPGGSPKSETFVYTSFLLLDRLETRHGPLINRGLPADSPLLDLMLPAREGNRRPHPPITGRGRLTPPLRSEDDPNLQVVIDWINMLRVPHPEYALDYKFAPPGPVRKEGAGGPQTQPAEPAQPSSQPAEDPDKP